MARMRGLPTNLPWRGEPAPEKGKKEKTAPKPPKGRALKMPKTLRSDQYPPAGPLRPAKMKQGYQRGKDLRQWPILQPDLGEEGKYKYTPQSTEAIVKKGFRKPPSKAPAEVVASATGGLSKTSQKGAKNKYYNTQAKENQTIQPTLAPNNPRRAYTEAQVGAWTKKKWKQDLARFGIDTSDMPDD